MKDTILKRAEQQLLGGGYDKLNFAKIAEDLNTTRANLHYHFKNKETLATEATKQYATRQFGEFEALREVFKGDFFGFFEAIDNSFWLEMNNEDDPGAFACSMLVTDPDLPASLVKLSQEFYRKVEKLLIDVVQDAIDNGEIRDDVNSKREAMRVHATMMGIMTCAHHFPNREQAKERFSGLLMDWANSLK